MMQLPTAASSSDHALSAQTAALGSSLQGSCHVCGMLVGNITAEQHDNTTAGSWTAAPLINAVQTVYKDTTESI